MSASALLLRRALHSEASGMDGHETMDEDTSTGGFDPHVFWGVNAFIFLLLLAACGFYCWCFKGALQGTGHPGVSDSDRIYHQTILQRREAALERKRESPEVRQQKLEQAIHLYGLRMVRSFLLNAYF